MSEPEDLVQTFIRRHGITRLLIEAQKHCVGQSRLFEDDPSRSKRWRSGAARIHPIIQSISDLTEESKKGAIHPQNMGKSG